MGRPGKRERHAQKQNWGKRHRRYRCTRFDAPGGAATHDGPWGKRKAARHHAWQLRTHATDRREADLLTRLSRSEREALPPKVSGRVPQGAGLQAGASATSNVARVAEAQRPHTPQKES